MDSDNKSNHDEKQSEILNDKSNIPVYKEPKFKKKLVMSGGGIRGISLIGVLYALEKMECLDHIEEFAGVSVGALIIALCVIGYSGCEIYEFIKLFNLSRLKSISFWNLNKYGLDTGQKIEYLLKRLIKGKGYDEDITLKKLYDLTKKKIIITTVCLNDIAVCYISHETHPNIPLYLAVRMSISLPIYYSPVFYEEKYYIDGGCLNNFPISLFDDDIDNVIGILLVENDIGSCKIENLEEYVMRVLQCIMKGINYNISKGYEKNTIKVLTDSINLINFDIDSQKIDTLFLNGYNSIVNNVDKILSL